VQVNLKHFPPFITLLSTFFALLMMAAHATAAATTIRWDITSLTFPNGVPTITAGGSDFALAADLTSIQVRGHGTFSDSGPATGGGTWSITGASGTTSGTFTVIELVHFVAAAGSVPPAFDDTIGNKADARSGLAVLRISYSDGSTGTLTISCHLPVKSPKQIFEGMTATKSFIGFQNAVPPVPGVNANRTIFHVVP
jgi:hypothetical protein